MLDRSELREADARKAHRKKKRGLQMLSIPPPLQTSKQRLEKGLSALLMIFTCSLYPPSFCLLSLLKRYKQEKPHQARSTEVEVVPHCKTTKAEREKTKTNAAKEFEVWRGTNSGEEHDSVLHSHSPSPSLPAPCTGEATQTWLAARPRSNHTSLSLTETTPPHRKPHHCRPS